MTKLEAISLLGELHVKDFLNSEDKFEFIINRHFDGTPPTDEDIYNDMLQIYHSAIETEVLPDIQYLELMNHLLSTLSLIPYNVDIINHIYSLKSEFEKFKADVIKELPKATFKDENVMVIRGSISEFETPKG